MTLGGLDTKSPLSVPANLFSQGFSTHKSSPERLEFIFSHKKLRSLGESNFLRGHVLLRVRRYYWKNPHTTYLCQSLIGHFFFFFRGKFWEDLTLNFGNCFYENN